MTTLSDRFDTMNIIYGSLWIILVTLAFTSNNPIVPHGDIVDQRDAQIFQSIIEHPTHPDQLNELYFFLFNLFAIIPILLASLLLPIHEIATTTIGHESSSIDNSNNNNQLPPQPSSSLPPQPFVIASAAIGYFAMGIYLTLRSRPTSSSMLLLSPSPSSPPTKTTTTRNFLQRTIQQQRNSITTNPKKNPLVDKEWSWYTKNLWENTIVQWLSVAFIIYLPFSSQTISAIQNSGWDTVYQDFVQLLHSSRFVAISCIDLFLLHFTCISLIPYDYTYRRRYTTALSSSTLSSDDDNNDELRGRQIAALAAFVPYLGTALYIALRPSVVIHKDGNDQ